MNCKCAFIVYTSTLGDVELDNFINTIGIEPGITEERLYYGLNKRTVEEDFQLSVFIHESLSGVLDKGLILKELKDKFNCFYELNIKFSLDEGDVIDFDMYNLNDEIEQFIKITDTYYNLTTIEK
ncbi:MAG: hypothetical protein K5892_04245 [Acholeplasmatales bacterium]|nr:hypothetical protein [Acholeplasmatales bacterium]